MTCLTLAHVRSSRLGRSASPPQTRFVTGKNRRLMAVDLVKGSHCSTVHINDQGISDVAALLERGVRVAPIDLYPVWIELQIRLTLQTIRARPEL
jgi:hypothetical protein